MNDRQTRPLLALREPEEAGAEESFANFHRGLLNSRELSSMESDVTTLRTSVTSYDDDGDPQRYGHRRARHLQRPLFSSTSHRWCVVREGPGRARRVPPGTPYKSAGLIVTRTVVYNAQGHPVLVTSATSAHRSVSDGQRHTSVPMPAEQASLADSPTSVHASPETPAGFVLPPAPWSPPSALGGQQRQSPEHTAPNEAYTRLATSTVAAAAAVASTHDTSPSTKVTLSSSPLSPKITASTPASTTQFFASPVPHESLPVFEKRRDKEEQRYFSEWLTMYPLLGVLPPRAVHEQRYIALEDPATQGTSANATTNMLQPNTSSASMASGAAAAFPVRVAQAEEMTIAIGKDCDQVASLRAATWGGCRPASMRATVWRLLCGGYAPSALARQASELARKRNLYVEAVRQYWPHAQQQPQPSHHSTLSCTPLTSPGTRAASLSVSDVFPSNMGSQLLPPQPFEEASLSTNDVLSGGGPRRTGGRADQPSSPGAPATRPAHHSRLLYFQKRSEDQKKQQALLDALGPSAPTPLATASRYSAQSLESTPLSPALATSSTSKTEMTAMSGSLSLLQQGLAPSLPSHERAILHQLTLDLPRHRSALYHCPQLNNAMARALFLWSQRHPAVGYVQGMDEVVSVFFIVFLTSAVRQGLSRRQQVMAGAPDAKTSVACRDVACPSPSSAHLLAMMDVAAIDMEGPVTTTTTTTDELTSFASLSHSPVAPGSEGDGTPEMPTHVDEVILHAWPLSRLESVLAQSISPSVLLQVEADCFHCAGRLLSTLQANYTPGLPGIARAGQQLEDILARAGHANLLHYLSQSSGLALRDGCYQWLHCLLARELPLALLLPLWDTYLSAGEDALMTLHICVCASLVMNLETQIRASAPEEVLRVLQRPFEAAFPSFIDVDSRPMTRGDRPVVPATTPSSSSSSTSPSSAARWAKPLSWLEVIIADAYRLWRQFT